MVTFFSFCPFLLSHIQSPALPMHSFMWSSFIFSFCAPVFLWKEIMMLLERLLDLVFSAFSFSQGQRTWVYMVHFTKFLLLWPKWIKTETYISGLIPTDQMVGYAHWTNPAWETLFALNMDRGEDSFHLATLKRVLNTGLTVHKHGLRDSTISTFRNNQALGVSYGLAS